MNRKSAFTLVELLVVIAIIGVLVALLLPAVQAAREAARRSSCQNNLSQLIIAVHNYEMGHGIYPPGTIDAKGPIVNAQLATSFHHGWIVQILPFIEERNTWNAIDKSLSIYHAKNAPATAVPLRVLSCPSSVASNTNISHYAGVHNDAEKPIDAKDNGVFFLNSRVRYEDIPDGSAHTIFIGEKIPDAWDYFWASGTRASLRNVGIPVNSLTFNTGLPRPGSSKAEIPLPPDAIPELDETPVAPEEPAIPAAPGAAPGGAAAVMPGNPLWVGGFGSTHPGGAQFAMGDGSVRFIPQSMAPAVLAQFANRADGKLPPGGF
jgi:prepilin-type N-terminal cleavage/methylation domain-containing protein/prepilin-type processing-associated H-X9-DG protein